MITTFLLTLAASYTTYYLTNGNVALSLLTWVGAGLVLVVLGSLEGK
jgi:hypothetical protein